MGCLTISHKCLTTSGTCLPCPPSRCVSNELVLVFTEVEVYFCKVVVKGLLKSHLLHSCFKSRIGTQGEPKIASFWLHQRNEYFRCKKVDSRFSCVAPRMEKFSLDPYILRELLKRMCLGSGVWGLCGVRGRRLIFFFWEGGGGGGVREGGGEEGCGRRAA